MKTAGIHISGSNALRSAVVIVQGSALQAPLVIVSTYDRIGSSGSYFSDDRIAWILTHEEPLASVFVDCPLTVPPCVDCQRPVCPGVMACDDLSVAYMLSLSAQIKRQGARKKRPVNPQSQRLWDIAYQADLEEGFEPSYSANMAPLIVRARTLQRRLKAEVAGVEVQETAIPHALRYICERLGVDPYYRFSYRAFENGVRIRTEIINALIAQYWLSDNNKSALKNISQSVDLFHAFIAGLAASLYSAGLYGKKPETFPQKDGWVHLPQFAAELS